MNSDCDEICIACLGKISSLPISLNSLSSVDNLTVSEMFSAVSTIEFINDDIKNFPENICDDCYDLLMEFYNFQKMCIKSFEKIKNIAVNKEVNDIVDYVQDDNDSDTIIMKEDNSIADAKLTDEEEEEEVEENPQLKKEYKCDVCQQNFATAVLLNTHKGFHKESEKFRCEFCNQSFIQIIKLNSHINSKHSDKKKYYCEHCQKGFRFICNLKDHVLIHTGEKPYLCPHCGQSFNNKSNLRQHKMCHTDLKLFKCSECSKQFKTKAALTRHGKSKKHSFLQKRVQQYICDLCEETFGKPYALREHRRVHHGEKLYVCHVCDKRFETNGVLTRHLTTIHTEIKPYKCYDCSKAFRLRSHFDKHQCGKSDKLRILTLTVTNN